MKNVVLHLKITAEITLFGNFKDSDSAVDANYLKIFPFYLFWSASDLKVTTNEAKKYGFKQKCRMVCSLARFM